MDTSTGLLAVGNVPGEALVLGYAHCVDEHFRPGKKVIANQTTEGLLGVQTLKGKMRIVYGELSQAIAGADHIELVAHSLGCLLAVWAMTLLTASERKKITSLTLVAPVGFYNRFRFLNFRFLFIMIGFVGHWAALKGLLFPWRGSSVPPEVAERLYGHRHNPGELCPDSSVAFLQLIFGLYPNALAKLLELGFRRRDITMVSCTLDQCVLPEWVHAEVDASGVKHSTINRPHCGGQKGFPI